MSLVLSAAYVLKNGEVLQIPCTSILVMMVSTTMQSNAAADDHDSGQDDDDDDNDADDGDGDYNHDDGDKHTSPDHLVRCVPSDPFASISLVCSPLDNAMGLSQVRP